MIKRKKKRKKIVPELDTDQLLPEGLTPEDVQAAAVALDEFEKAAELPIGRLPN